MSNDNRYPYGPGGRFIQPDRAGQVDNPYDQDSRLFQDLDQRKLKPVSVIRLDVSTAGFTWIKESGYHFVCFGDDGSVLQATKTTILVNAYINASTDSGGNPFPAKHNRGFSGPFYQLYLTWPANGTSTFVNLVIYKNWAQPWVDGETAT